MEYICGAFKATFQIPGFLPSRTIEVQVRVSVDAIIPHPCDGGWKVQPAAGLALRALVLNRKGYIHLLEFDEEHGQYLVDERPKWKEEAVWKFTEREGWKRARDWVQQCAQKPLQERDWLPLKEWAKTAYHQLSQVHQNDVREALRQMKESGDEDESRLSDLLPKYWGSPETCKHECSQSMFRC